MVDGCRYFTWDFSRGLAWKSFIGTFHGWLGRSVMGSDHRVCTNPNLFGKSLLVCRVRWKHWA